MNDNNDMPKKKKKKPPIQDPWKLRVGRFKKIKYLEPVLMAIVPNEDIPITTFANIFNYSRSAIMYHINVMKMPYKEIMVRGVRRISINKTELIDWLESLIKEFNINI